MNRYGVRDHLHDAELFRNLSEGELYQVWSLCSQRKYGAGEDIYLQGGAADSIYIVAGGAVSLLRLLVSPSMIEGREVVLDVLQPGRVFGWSCLVRPHVHTATAKTLRETELIVIDADMLKLTIENNPLGGFKVMLSLMQLIADRLRMAYSTLDVVLNP